MIRQEYQIKLLDYKKNLLVLLRKKDLKSLSTIWNTKIREIWLWRLNRICPIQLLGLIINLVSICHLNIRPYMGLLRIVPTRRRISLSLISHLFKGKTQTHQLNNINSKMLIIWCL